MSGVLGRRRQFCLRGSDFVAGKKVGELNRVEPLISASKRTRNGSFCTPIVDLEFRGKRRGNLEQLLLPVLVARQVSKAVDRLVGSLVSGNATRDEEFTCFRCCKISHPARKNRLG